MADGYARASGRVGVCMATSGRARRTWSPASRPRCSIDSDRLHHRPGLVEGARNRCVSGSGHHRHHAADHQAQLPRHARRRYRAGDSPGLPDRDLRQAGAGVDGHHEGCAAGHRAIQFAACAPCAARPHPMLRAESSSIREAVALIQAAKRPIILAGHGIMESGAERQVIDFAESQQIPVASTLLGLGASLPRIRCSSA